MKCVLALGLDPACVAPEVLGAFDPEQVRAFIESQLARVRAAGYEVINCLLDSRQAPEAAADRALQSHSYVCVMIGAGLRAPEQLLLFEKLVNLIHARAPGAKLCFNSKPADTLDAVRRWA